MEPKASQDQTPAPVAAPVKKEPEAPRPAQPSLSGTTSSQPAKPSGPTSSPPGKLSGKQGIKGEPRRPEPSPEIAARIELARGEKTLASLSELISRAGSGDEKAAARLLLGGEDAARALVMALPGTLKNRERQALGDPIGEPVFARGPLLALLPRMGRPAVQPLLERLQNPETSPDVRYYVALCFTELPVDEAIGPLGQRLFDNDDSVRMAAVSALRNYAPSEELRDLLDTLRSELLGPDTRRQMHSVEALGELRDVKAVPRLIQLLSHSDLLLAEAAAKALQSIAKQDLGRSRWRWRWWWRSHQGEPRLRWVLEALLHQNGEVRAAAQDELRSLSGDVAGYRFDLPRRERESAQQRWSQWWQRRGFSV